MHKPASILITGASRGIGAALARTYAAHGKHLALIARDEEQLGRVAADCERRGARCTVLPADVTDDALMEKRIAEAHAAAPLDLVIANAGVAAGGSETPERTRGIFSVNVDGTINTILPAIAAMRPRGRGQIAVMSSLAAFLGLPGAAAYCASKGAVRLYAEALRAELAETGIGVTAICPGFVRTAMTEGQAFPQPLVVDPDRAAQLIRRGLARNPPLIAFPWPLYAAARMTGRLPERVRALLLRRLHSLEMA